MDFPLIHGGKISENGQKVLLECGTRVALGPWIDSHRNICWKFFWSQPKWNFMTKFKSLVLLKAKAFTIPDWPNLFLDSWTIHDPLWSVLAENGNILFSQMVPQLGVVRQPRQLSGSGVYQRWRWTSHDKQWRFRQQILRHALKLYTHDCQSEETWGKIVFWGLPLSYLVRWKIPVFAKM